MTEIIHIACILMAIVVLWAIRSRILLLLIGLILAPLPVVIIDYINLPPGAFKGASQAQESAAQMGDTEVAESAEGCKAGDEKKCAKNSQLVYLYLVIIFVNYSTIYLGLIAGALATRAGRRKQPENSATV